MSTPTIKPDPDINIKTEPTGAPPTIKPEPVDDDSLYEDAGDLDLSAGTRDIWLVKLPAFITERWKDIDDDEEITLGTVKIPPQSEHQDMTKLKLVLEKNDTNGLDTPVEYDLQLTNLEVRNTYVFTEKDMPGYESRNTQKPGEPPIPSRLLYNQRGGGGEGGGKKDWKNQRHQPYRKAIPKRTALVGTARHEITMIPVYNEEYRKFQHERQILEDGPKYHTKRMHEDVRPNLLAAGTTGSAGKQFQQFIKPTQTARKATDPKAFRMSRQDLQSSLFSCFQQHEYWSMKALRERLAQPEAYLKEVLDEIGIMHKSGSFSGKWSLKPEYATFSQGGGAPAGGGGGANADTAISIEDDEDDEEEPEMVDVL
ncbi:transcription initiation factor IIF, beta subunit [Ascodesmis nigricans]|uniref:Transcription initiation factor IIF subunit beta n=1 Tax=Ascodesmis nigricans TaxID=341454 RepID=A0A4S2N2Q3_9PEZI|nr:transcription initiation factor IIF, beta subunit [Ascodesmis nigricans]